MNRQNIRHDIYHAIASEQLLITSLAHDTLGSCHV